MPPVAPSFVQRLPKPTECLSVEYMSIQHLYHWQEENQQVRYFVNVLSDRLLPDQASEYKGRNFLQDSEVRVTPVVVISHRTLSTQPCLDRHYNLIMYGTRNQTFL